MEQPKITPERITKPIQLLGAWLVGLLSVDSAFLVAATQIDATTWQSGALTIAAIVNVPIFIGALFLLQTKFRPELQEDSYYSTYLSSRTNELVRVSKKDALAIELEKKKDLLEKQVSQEMFSTDSRSKLSNLSYGLNVHLSNRDQILSKLSSIGVMGFTDFGDHVEPPSFNKVAVSQSLTNQQLKEILMLSKELGFTHYGFIEHFEDIPEDVLFGAYGENDFRRIIPV